MIYNPKCGLKLKKIEKNSQNHENIIGLYVYPLVGRQRRIDGLSLNYWGLPGLSQGWKPKAGE